MKPIAALFQEDTCCSAKTPMVMDGTVVTSLSVEPNTAKTSHLATQKPLNSKFSKLQTRLEPKAEEVTKLPRPPDGINLDQTTESIKDYIEVVKLHIVRKKMSGNKTDGFQSKKFVSIFK